MREQEKIGLQRLDRAAKTALGRWQTRLLPEVVRNLEAMEQFDLPNASLRQLLTYVNHVLKIEERHWAIHFTVVYPLERAVNRLMDAYAECTGERNEMAVYRLLQGLENKTNEANRHLWRLSVEAKATPSIARVFAEDRGSDLLARLGEDEIGRAFLRKLEEFLDVHGCKSVLGSEDISQATWREDPSFVLSVIRGHQAREAYDFEAELRVAGEERERQLEEVRSVVRNSPVKRRRFDAALTLAQETWPLRKDHAYYIDQKSVALVRQVFVESNRRFAASGVLDRPQDVFLLRLDEIREAAGRLGRVDLRPLAAQRRREWNYWVSLKPPRFVGTPPPRPVARTPARPSPASPDGRIVLRGMPGSVGIVRGVARIISSPADFDRLRPGEIAVCETTKPPWTPIFATIGGLVTDTGGALSHGAVVAREYRLPAVMGTRQGTRIIRDGQMIELDGAQGLVFLEADGQPILFASVSRYQCHSGPSTSASFMSASREPVVE